MRTKEIVTAKQIEFDIINSLKQQKDMTEDTHQKIMILSAIVGCLLCLIGFLFPWTVVWCILAAIIGCIMYILISYLSFRHKRSRFCIDDYQVQIQKLSYNTQESYIDKSGRRHITVNIYVMHFEDGRCWTVPDDNYRWSKELPMSENAVLQNSNAGDDFITVAEKATGKIVVAYNTKFFEYKAEK